MENTERGINSVLHGIDGGRRKDREQGQWTVDWGLGDGGWRMENG